MFLWFEVNTEANLKWKAAVRATVLARYEDARKYNADNTAIFDDLSPSAAACYKNFIQLRGILIESLSGTQLADTLFGTLNGHISLTR